MNAHTTSRMTARLERGDRVLIGGGWRTVASITVFRGHATVRFTDGTVADLSGLKHVTVVG